MRSVASVCLSVLLALTFESLNLQTAFWFAGTFSEYLVQIRISRSSGQVKVTGGKSSNELNTHIRAFTVRHYSASSWHLTWTKKDPPSIERHSYVVRVLIAGLNLVGVYLADE